MARNKCVTVLSCCVLILTIDYWACSFECNFVAFLRNLYMYIVYTLELINK